MISPVLDLQLHSSGRDCETRGFKGIAASIVQAQTYQHADAHHFISREVFFCSDAGHHGCHNEDGEGHGSVPPRALWGCMEEVARLQVQLHQAHGALEEQKRLTTQLQNGE